MGNKLKELTIGNIFLPKDRIEPENYVIPRYQRNYAWKQPEVVQLIQDIYDFSKSKNSKSENYYIGTLVVYEREKNGKIVFETIDGQQRLTTLNILFSVLKNEFNISSESFKINLSFDSRPLSTFTLEHIFDPPNADINKSNNKLNTRITDAYITINKELKKIEKVSDHNNVSHLKHFIKYLKEKVVLLRAPVPHDTNLNHYFEIMNNRGEQLEKHEVLKAQMLKVFQNDKKATKVFDTIWEACAHMEKYVQYGFSNYKNKDEEDKRSIRSKVFGNDWNNFVPSKFEEIKECFTYKNKQSEESESILAIIENNKITSNNSQESKEAPERFSSIINFSNFLLHILRVLVNESDKYTSEEKLKNVPLDDKRLLDTFKPFVDNKEFVEDFAFLLLKGKHFYDKYIIKRNLKEEKWSLKYLKGVDNKPRYLNSFGQEDVDVNGFNRKSLMVLSMFHFSAPTLVYKHWLNAALKFLLMDNLSIEGEKYINYLEELSDAYLYDRFLSYQEKDYYEIIYLNKSKKTNQILNLEKLNLGTQVENFIFNRLDYLLWKQDEESSKKIFSNFYFSLRTSVEHYYPQNPNHKEDKLDDKSVLDNFGNLCLISNRKNSQLSNALPEIKKGYYKDNDRIVESLKQRHMMNDYNVWRKEQILDHAEKMKNILLTTKR